jgi:chondroitin AC lyase
MKAPINFLSKIMLLGLLLFFIYAGTSLSQVDIVTERLRNNLIRIDINDSEVSGYLKTMNTDGSWGDIDYKRSVNWQAPRHLARLHSICVAYNKPENSNYHHKEVKEKIRKSIEFYIQAKPWSSGWWQNAIGAPIVIGPVLILMKTGDSYGLEQHLLDSYADALLNYYTESAIKWPSEATGANRTWLLNSSIYKACIKADEKILRQNFKIAFEEARIIEDAGEGIKADYSFFQHGPQLYNAGYGINFMLDMTYFGVLAHGTTFQMTGDQLTLLTNLLLDGYQWFSHRSMFDFQSGGREITRPSGISTSAMKTAIMRFKEMNAPRLQELENYDRFIDGRSDFQSPGNKHFWKADIMVHHGKDFYISARVPSSRTIGTEKVSTENLKRKYLPWGTTSIMVDGDEYRHIFPVWDWARIPGVTSVREEVEREDPDANQSTINLIRSTYYISSSEFAGGVSDGTFGLAAYDYSRDGITARKAYFFTPEAMFCLGAGIAGSKTNPVITNVNQCNSSGLVTIMNKEGRSVFEGTEKVFADLHRVHHDKLGYIFPSEGQVTVKNMDQTGSWRDISNAQSDAPVTRKVFSIWIDHGNEPKDGVYQYIVAPSLELEPFVKWADTNPLISVSNNRDYQAVWDKRHDVFGLAFYRSGTMILEPGLAVLVSKPCLLILRRINKGTSYRISISDPTARLLNIILKISITLKGEDAMINPDGSSSVSFVFPSGENAGKSTTMEFIADPASTSSGFDGFRAGPLPNFY